MTRRDTILKLLCHLAPRLLAERFAKNRCIVSTRVALEVCSHFGIKAEPRPVMVQAWNRAFQEVMERRQRGEDISDERAFEMDARYLVLDTNNEQPAIKGWPGHLVAYLAAERPGERGALLDLNAGQFRRPGIEAPEAGLFNLTRDWDRASIYELPNGGMLAYEPPLVPFPPYEGAPDWRAKGAWWPTVRDIVLHIETVLKEEAAHAT